MATSARATSPYPRRAPGCAGLRAAVDLVRVVVARMTPIPPRRRRRSPSAARPRAVTERRKEVVRDGPRDLWVL